MNKLVFVCVSFLIFCTEKQQVFASEIDNLPVLPYSFEQLYVLHGLPHSNVRSIYQDSKGFIWIGTGNGLARYNGHDFQVFQHDFSNNNSLPGNTVIRLKEANIAGQEGIWVVTIDNIAWLNIETMNITRISPLGIAEPVFEYNNVLDIFRTLDGSYYLLTRSDIYLIDLNNFSLKKSNLPFTKNPISYSSVTSAGEFTFFGSSLGLIIYDQSENKYRIIDAFQEVPEDFQGFSIPQMLASDKNTLFLGTLNGLYSMDIPSETIRTVIEPQDGKIVSIRNLFINNQRQQLYIPTTGHGIFVYDLVGKSLTRIGDKKLGLFSQSNTVFIDRQNNIWIGHIQDGLSRASLIKSPFKQINEAFGSGNMIYGLEALPDGHIIVGNSRGQLFIFNPENNTLSKFISDQDNPFYTPLNAISGVIYYDDHTGKLWLGNFSRGLMLGDLKFTNGALPLLQNRQLITMETNHPSTIKGWSVRCITRDDNNRIWVGTLDGGINILTPDGRNHKDNELDSALSIAFPRGARHILNPSHAWDNVLLISDHRGVHIVDINTKKIQRLSDMEYESPFSNLLQYPVWMVHQQDENTFWLATANTGLIRVILEDGRNINQSGINTFTLSSIKVFHTSEGFPSNLLYGILSDDNGHLWLSSERGLIRFNIRDEAFEIFNQENGLQQIEFYFGSAVRNAIPGYLFFGGAAGLTWFHPDSIRPDTIAPFPVITAAKLFSNPLLPGSLLNKQFVVKKDIPFIDTLVFKYSQNVLSFDLAAIKYSGFKGNKTAYLLEGFDRDWRYTTKGFEGISYTNLNPGSYTLRVKAINSDNIWSKTEDHIYIKVLPPWWQTLWARIAWLLLAVLLIFVLLQIVKIRERMRNEIKLQKIELDKEKTIARKMKELEEAKTNFFTNISHEFRTPLTLILGPLDDLIKNPRSGEVLAIQLNLIKKNGKRLLHLINQLLDIQKLEKEAYRLSLFYDDYIGFVRSISESFEPLAINKQINYTFQSFTERYDTPFDPDVAEKVLFNLLSNAFKYTPVKGEITLSIFLDNNQDSDHLVRVRISDNGPGIPLSEKDNIFKRFYRYEQKARITATGTGIGLSLSRQLAELHKGTLMESGVAGQGAIFDFSFPAGAQAYDGEVFISSEPEVSETLINPGPIQHASIPLATFENFGQTQAVGQTTNKMTILAIDDNPDILQFLSTILSASWNLIYATDGNEGLRIAREQNPDLIISDVIMPNMDGLEMATLIKEDHHTSHIPIIMLTSRNTQDQELEGLKHGADDYLRKPFNQEILVARIQNVFSAREKWYKKAKNDMDFTEPGIHIVDTDRKFLDSLKKNVNENISEPNFTTEALARNMGISRTLLFKKLKGLLNETGSGFILAVRMKSATKYLEKSDLTIAEICYLTGFSDPKYFSKVFKKHHGISPKEFRDRHFQQS
jgi:signal transduction histidine kinase/DNA-binding response OmpR family regulator/ligand-binding sensor domain-containing protein